MAKSRPITAASRRMGALPGPKKVVKSKATCAKSERISDSRKGSDIMAAVGVAAARGCAMGMAKVEAKSGEANVNKVLAVVAVEDAMESSGNMNRGRCCDCFFEESLGKARLRRLVDDDVLLNGEGANAKAASCWWLKAARAMQPQRIVCLCVLLMAHSILDGVACKSDRSDGCYRFVMVVVEATSSMETYANSTSL